MLCSRAASGVPTATYMEVQPEMLGSQHGAALGLLGVTGNSVKS